MTAAVKESILAALNDPAGGAGADFFLSLKTSKSGEDRRAFATLCGRLLPHEVTGTDGAPLIPPDSLSIIEQARRCAFLLELGLREQQRTGDE